MLTWLANRIIAFALRHPWLHIEGYMERYWVLPYSRWRWLPAIRVHRILRSDKDRVCHDHPWNYLTVIMRGGYTEVTPLYDRSGLYIGETRRWHGSGAVLFRKATHWHRLELAEGCEAWTLFITFGYKQKWGFLTHPEHKTRYEAYLNLPKR